MTDLQNARALVVGAPGFIGAQLVRALLMRGANVTAVVRPGGSSHRLDGVRGDIELVMADLADPDSSERAVAAARPDVVLNLAMPFGHPKNREERLAQLETSVLGTARLVEALARAGSGRLVQVGSSLEYGTHETALSEDCRPAPLTARGGAKAAATVVGLAWAAALGVPACVLRPFSVYGPGEDERRLVPSAIRAAVEGGELPLTEPGLAHDFVYVDDVVEAIVLAAGSTAALDGRIVNIGTGRQVTNEELVALVERVVGRPVRTRPGAYPSSPHDSKTWVADVDLARELLGWQARTELAEGIRRTADWMRAATLAP